MPAPRTLKYSHLRAVIAAPGSRPLAPSGQDGQGEQVVEDDGLLEIAEMSEEDVLWLLRYRGQYRRAAMPNNVPNEGEHAR